MPKINYDIQATSMCYGGARALSSIKYIVLHYTAVNGDTAKNEASYFSRNYSRYAGAHFFVDQSGTIAQSISMDLTAWSVGGSKYYGTNPKYFGVCTNFNSVSIEMCDQVTKDASAKQIEAVRWLISYIQGKCPNAKTIIRHYDVNGKPCPARYLDDAKWNSLKKAVTGGGSTPYKVEIIKAVNVRSKASATSKKVMVLYPHGVYTIVKESSNKKWGKLKSGAGWISLSNKYIKKLG